jgi:MYXO-CTERM domain-containing protein
VGDYTFTFTATDQYGCTGSQSYTISITTPPDLAHEEDLLPPPESDLARELPDLSRAEPDLAGLPTEVPDLATPPQMPTSATGCSCDVAAADRDGRGWLLAVLVVFALRRRRGIRRS